MHSADGGFLRTPHEDLTVKDIRTDVLWDALAGGVVVYRQNTERN